MNNDTVIVFNPSQNCKSQGDLCAEEHKEWFSVKGCPMYFIVKYKKKLPSLTSKHDFIQTTFEIMFDKEPKDVPVRFESIKIAKNQLSSIVVVRVVDYHEEDERKWRKMRIELSVDTELPKNQLSHGRACYV